jgi:hypothetical protein
MVRIHWQTRRPIVKTRISSAAALAVASVFLLAGCSFSFGGPTTVSSDDLADLAEEALEDEYDDSSWKVDCDDDDEEVEVKLEEDESIDCLATDKDSDLEYDAEVTITDVDGDKYEIEVELDDEANNADEESDDDSDSKGDGDSDGETYFVSGEDLAALAVELPSSATSRPTWSATATRPRSTRATGTSATSPMKTATTSWSM